VKDDGPAFRFAHENTVRRDDVQVHEAAEHGVETLHEGDGSRLAAPSTMPSAAAFCLCPLRELFHEDSVLRRQGVRSQRERSANFVRYCQHPLPERHVRQDVLLLAPRRRLRVQVMGAPRPLVRHTAAGALPCRAGRAPEQCGPEPRTHDERAIAEMQAWFDAQEEWQEVFAEIDRLDPYMWDAKPRSV
jgi:hypothetical protein